MLLARRTVVVSVMDRPERARQASGKHMSHPYSGYPVRLVLALVGLAISGIYLHRHFELHGLDQLSLNRRSGEPVEGHSSFLASFLPTTPANLPAEQDAVAGQTTLTSTAPARPEPASDRLAAENLRIATWAMGGFGAAQSANAEVMAVFTSVIQRFDIVALQQIRATERDFLPNLITRLNQTGRRYDYLAGPLQEPPGGGADAEQLVFLFDTARVVTDRTQLYSVADPDNRLTHKPLVAWFRAAEVDPRHAWTFSLVNMRVELSRARQEVYELPRVIAAIGADGRGEDDVVVAGLLQADHVYLAATLGERNHALAIKSKMTDIFTRHQTSNIITDRRATTEAIGRGGVLDFLRYHNLSIAQAEQVSPYLPVYAEFSPMEGGY